MYSRVTERKSISYATTPKRREIALGKRRTGLTLDDVEEPHCAHFIHLTFCPTMPQCMTGLRALRGRPSRQICNKRFASHGHGAPRFNEPSGYLFGEKVRPGSQLSTTIDSSLFLVLYMIFVITIMFIYAFNSPQHPDRNE